MLRLSRTDACKKTSIFEENGVGTIGLQGVGHSVQIQLSPLSFRTSSRSQGGIGEIKRLSLSAGWSAGERGSVDLDDRPRSTTSGTPARCGLAAGRSLPRSASARRIGSPVGYPYLR